MTQCRPSPLQTFKYHPQTSVQKEGNLFFFIGITSKDQTPRTQPRPQSHEQWGHSQSIQSIPLAKRYLDITFQPPSRNSNRAFLGAEAMGLRLRDIPSFTQRKNYSHTALPRHRAATQKCPLCAHTKLLQMMLLSQAVLLPNPLWLCCRLHSFHGA